MSAPKKLHEKNWRESLPVTKFHHPPNFPWILAAIPGISEFNELSRSIVVSSGCPDRSSTELNTCTGEMSLLFPSSRSRIWISLTVCEEDETEEDDEEWLSCFDGVFEVDDDPEDELDKPGTTIGTKFSVLHIIRIPSLMRCGFGPLIHS